MPDDDPYNRAGKPSQDAVAYVKEQIAQPIRPHRFELIPDHRYHLLCRAGEAANKPVRMGTHMFSGLGVLRGREPRARVPMEVLGIEAAGAKRRSSSTRSRRKRYRSLSMPSSLPVQCVKLSWSFSFAAGIFRHRYAVPEATTIADPGTCGARSKNRIVRERSAKRARFAK